MPNPIREKLAKQSIITGMQCFTGSASLVEIMGVRGFDWVSLDMEHSTTSWGQIEQMVRAAECTGLLPLVRVARNDDIEIMKALDAGAAGVIVPHISSADDARRALKAARFPPDGERGTCHMVRASRYGRVPAREYARQSNEDVVVVPLIEGREAIEQLDEILELEGIDVLWIGIGDLAASYGLTGATFQDERLKAVARDVNERAARHKKTLMAPAAPPLTADYAGMLLDLGFRAISWGTDTSVFARACEQALDACAGQVDANAIHQAQST